MCWFISLTPANLRSYWRSGIEKTYSYRHKKGTEVGIVTAFFDGHATWMSEDQSRFPGYWWPKGTTLPARELNRDSLKTVFNDLDGSDYRVRR